MRSTRAVVCCAALLAAAVPAAAAPPRLNLYPGQAFRVAGTRVGCWVTGAATSPSVECGLWGRTTRVVPGTMTVRTGEDAVEVYVRSLDGELSLLRRIPQPPPAPPAEPLPPPPESARTMTLYTGDVASVPGTDLSCSVVRSRGLGARCIRFDPATGQLAAASALVTLTESSVLAALVNSRGVASTVFYQRQPFIPSRDTVERALRGLDRASRRLAVLRRVYHGTSSGYRTARSAFRAIEADVRHDRYLAACVKFTPLLYHGFYLPVGSVARGAGHRYLASVRRIRRALCN